MLALFASVRLPLGARADGASPAPSLTVDRRAEALRAFEQANLHYELGEYDEAVSSFRRAYEISHEPALVFNIAQAHRMGGDCRRALEAYRQFVRLSADAPLRSTAEKHIEALRSSCVVTAPVVSAPAAQPLKPSPAPASSTWSTLGLVGAGVGLATGATAAALYFWNGGRYTTWQKEDARLKAPNNRLTPAESIARQDANDRFWLSIERTDTATLVLAASGAALTLSGALAWALLRPHQSTVKVSFVGAGVAAAVQW